MKWLILLALVACSSQDPKPKSELTPEQEIEAAAAKAEQKPASPYTVKPCYCMKIFKPVCAGGQNFGNSCEAECNGHKTWTEGPCGKSKK